MKLNHPRFLTFFERPKKDFWFMILAQV
jgi:hypothetical protein